MVNRAARAHVAINPARQLEITTYARMEPNSRLTKTTMEILTKAIDGAQNFCIIHDPCEMTLDVIVIKVSINY